MPSNQLVAIENHSSMTSLVAGVLAIWLGIVVLLGASGVFVRPPGELPFPILIGVTVPIIVFFVAFRGLPRFHSVGRPSARDRNTGVEICRAWLSGALHSWGAARSICLARWAW